MSGNNEIYEPKSPEPPVDQAVIQAALDKAESERLAQQKQKRGRGNLLMISVLSTANVALLIADASMLFAFALFSPVFIMGLGAGMSMFSGSEVFTLVAMTASLVIVGVFWLLWALSKRHIAPVWIFGALYAIDTLFLLSICLSSGAVQEFIIDIAFHIWALVSIGLYLSYRTKENRRQKGLLSYNQGANEPLGAVDSTQTGADI